MHDSSLKFALRDSTPEDAPYAAALEQAEEHARWVGPWPAERHVQLMGDPDHQHLVILDDAGARAGFVILFHMRAQRIVELVRIHSEQIGVGAGRAALRLVQDLAFREMGAHRLELDTFEHNARARRVFEAAGFSLEGVLRDRVFRDGRFISLAVMSMLEGEYRSHQK